VVRPAVWEDIRELADLEAAAFEPRWQYSLEALETAWKAADCFTVAEVAGHVTGFQVSLVAGQRAHLARLTVHPSAQRRGIGARLLADALEKYVELGVEQVSLNTQTVNSASLHLYHAFDFRPTGPPLAVWERPVGR
jgi:ribosomal protein S18 acetylase RimI-like enzyme